MTEELKTWEDIGRYYMRKARELGVWRGFIHGLVHTFAFSVDHDKRAIDRLLKIVPTSDHLDKRCPIDPNRLAGLRLRNLKIVADAICDKKDFKDVFLDAVRECNRRKLQHMKMNKTDMFGLNWKAIDMVLLDSGCDVPVVDIHLARYLIRKNPRLFEKLKELFPKAKLDEPTKENIDKAVRLAQLSPKPKGYNLLWKTAVEEAKKHPNLSAGEWHVSVWMKERFSRKPYNKLTEEQRLELAKQYVKKLFA